MNFQKIFVFGLFAVATLFTSCSKDEDNRTRTELITHDAGWTLEAVLFNTDELAAEYASSFNITEEEAKTLLEASLQEEFDDCEKDDVIKFLMDGMVTYSDEGTVCQNDEEDFEDNSSWQFNTDETQLLITEDNETYSFMIISLNDSTLEISIEGELEDQNGDPLSQKLVITYRFKAN